MNDDTMTTDSSNALPDDFLPGEHDVVIGKGKKFYSHAGNVWLRSVVAGRIQEYSSAPNKADKSSIISAMVDYIRDHGRFVKQDVKSGGKWVHAEDLLCREKCGQAFRDNLAETYRSSSARKGNKRVGSSSDLINALRKTTLSSKESRDNLRHANSMGNFLRPNRSSGQFSAARKASFNKLNAASAAHNTKGGGNMANATWAPSSRNFNNRGATSSNKILAQLRANHMPGLGGGTNLQQPQFHPHHQQQSQQLQQSQLQANLQQQQAQHGLMSGSLQNSNRILAQLQANAELQRQVQMNAQLLNGSNHNHNHAALQPTPLAPGSQPGLLRSGSPQDGLAAQQLPSLEPTPIREASHHQADHHQQPPPQPKSPIMADAQVSKLKQLQEQLQLDWEASTKNPSNVVGVVPEPPPVSILAEDHPHDNGSHMDDLLSMPIMELQSDDVVDPNSVEFSAEFELPGLSPEDEFAILE